MCAWPCRCADLTLRGDAQTGRTVGGHDVWNAVFRKIAVAVGIRDRGIRLAAKQMNQIIVVQLGGKFIQGNLSLVNVDQRMRVFLIEIQQKVGAASACCRGESSSVPGTIFSKTQAFGSLAVPCGSSS